MRDYGIVEPGTTLPLPFHTFSSDDPSASITLTGLAVTDIEIYKDGSATQRASDAGYALLDTDGIDFDGITGIHGLSINLADNTTAGFYAAGSQYWVVISSVTVDGATVNFVLATFRIGKPAAILNTTIATLTSQTSFTLTAGPAEDDALNGMWAVIHDVASAVQQAAVEILDYTGSTRTVTLAAGATFTVAATDNISIMGPSPLRPATAGRTLVVESDGMAHADVKEILGSAVSSGSAQIGVNVVNIASDADAAGKLVLFTEVLNGSGQIHSGTLATDTITAAKVANAAIDAATFAADVDAEARSWIGLGSPDLDAQLSSIAGRLIPLAVKTGAVVDDAANASTTFKTNFTEAATDHWKDAWLVITSGDLVGQVKRVTAFNPTTDFITVFEGFTAEPASGVTLALVNR